MYERYIFFRFAIKLNSNSCWFILVFICTIFTNIFVILRIENQSKAKQTKPISCCAKCSWILHHKQELKVNTKRFSRWAMSKDSVRKMLWIVFNSHLRKVNSKNEHINLANWMRLQKNHRYSRVILRFMNAFKAYLENWRMQTCANRIKFRICLHISSKFCKSIIKKGMDRNTFWHTKRIPFEFQQ